MAQQTAVDWLYDQIEQYKLTFGDAPINVLQKYRKQCKQMDKEQKIEFAKQCLNKALDTDIRTAYKNVEQYYNDTYGTE
jgi:20S proteasome alpha/beta subunit